MPAGYEVDNATSIALTASVPRTVLMLVSPATFGLVLKRFTVSFDGVTATAVPGFVEIVTSTNATNSTPGTANTNLTSAITQSYGRAVAAGFTAFGASTTEPTVLTVIKRFLITPTSALVLYDYPLGTEPDIGVSAGLGLRFTFPAAVNVHASMEVERL